MSELNIRVGKVIDGTGTMAENNVSLIIKDGQILRLEKWQKVESINQTDKTIVEFPNSVALPGLIDCHTHTNMPANGRSGEDVIGDGDGMRLLRSARNARTALKSGVTTMCDNGAWNQTGFSLKEGIREGEVAGPNLLACGRPITITGGHLWFMGSQADGIDGVRQATRQLIKEGADFIKVIATGGSTVTSNPFRPAFTVEELRIIREEAHSHDKMVAAHCRSNQGISRVIDAGYDGIFHAFFTDEAGSPCFDAEIARRISTEGIWVNPTLHIGRSWIWAMERKMSESGLTEEEETLLPDRRKNHLIRLEHCNRMIEMGVKLIAGSDCGWGRYPFGQLTYELECMVRAGLSPMQAICSATSEAAVALGIQDRVGTLVPGKQADILIVDGDPSKNILDLNNVVGIFKEGVRISPQQ